MNEAAVLKIRPRLLNYTRDSYLTSSELNSTAVCDIDCSIGYSPFGSSKLMLEKMAKFNFEKVSEYGELFHEKLLKPLIQERFTGANLDADQIFFGHGSFNLAERIIHKIVLPGPVLGVGPQFNEIPSEMDAAGGSYKTISFPKDFLFPLEELESELSTGQYSMLYLDNPNNPTGQLIPLESIDRLTTLAEKFGTLVMIDEAYGDFVDDSHSAFHLVSDHTNMFVIRSYSKAMGLAGARVGYCAASKSLVGFFQKVDVPFEPSAVAAAMAGYTTEDKDYLTLVRNTTQQIKTKIMNALTAKGITVLPTHPDVSIFLAHKEGANLYNDFLEMGIRLEPGMAYKLTCSFMDNSFVRVRIPSLHHVEEFLTRIEKMQVSGAST